MKSICVYAGSASGNKIEYTDKARELGHAIAEKGFSSATFFAAEQIFFK